MVACSDNVVSTAAIAIQLDISAALRYRFISPCSKWRGSDHYHFQLPCWAVMLRSLFNLFPLVLTSMVPSGAAMIVIAAAIVVAQVLWFIYSVNLAMTHSIVFNRVITVISANPNWALSQLVRIIRTLLYFY